MKYLSYDNKIVGFKINVGEENKMGQEGRIKFNYDEAKYFHYFFKIYK